MKFVLGIILGLFKGLLIWLMVCLWHWLSPADMPYFSFLQCIIFQGAVCLAQDWHEEEDAEEDKDTPN